MKTTEAPQTAAPSIDELEADVAALKRRRAELAAETAEAAAELDAAREAMIEADNTEAVAAAQARHGALEASLGRVAERLAAVEDDLRTHRRRRSADEAKAQAAEHAKATAKARVAQAEAVAELEAAFERTLAVIVAHGETYEEHRRQTLDAARRAEDAGASPFEVDAAIEGAQDAMGRYQFDTATKPPAVITWRRGDGTEPKGWLKQAYNFAAGELRLKARREQHREQMKRNQEALEAAHA